MRKGEIEGQIRWGSNRAGLSHELKGGQGLEDAEELLGDWKWSEIHLLAVCPESKSSLEGKKK